MPYEARRKEVLLELAGVTRFDAKAKEAITATLTSYFVQRDARIDNLLELLEPRDEMCHALWIEKVRAASTAASELLGRAEQGRIWLAKIMQEEATFYFELQNSAVPWRRDDMVRQTKALAKAEQEFEQKWKVIADTDKGIDDRLKAVGEQYSLALDDAARTAAKVQKESSEAMAGIVKQAISLALRLVDFGVVETIIKRGTAAIVSSMSQVEARKLEIQALFSREEGVFGTFREGRQMVQEFLKTTSYPLVKDAFDGAEDAAEALPARMTTPGQKADALAIGIAMKYELAPVFTKAEEAYKAFARKHEYLFFGPLGSAYYTELGDDETWKTFSRNWESSRDDIDELLRQRNFVIDDKRILEVSIAGLAPHDYDRVYNSVLPACEELMKVWNRFKEMTNDPDWAFESRETLRSILNAMR